MKVSIGRYRKPLRKVRIELIEDDMFSLYNTLAKIIHPCLVKFKESQMGYPHNLSKKKWNEILDKMIWSFSDLSKENMSAPIPSDYGFKDYECESYDHHNLCYLEWKNSSGYSEWTKDYEIYRKKIKEGLRLFGIYFESLWC